MSDLFNTLASISSNDYAACATLTFLSFLASVVVGSTSLGDGVFLQITWGVVTSLFSYVTTESSLGSDGMRVITIFMYIRMVFIPPYLLWLLWTGPKKELKKQQKKYQRALEELRRISQQASPIGITPSSPHLPAMTPPPTTVTNPHQFSYTLFWLTLIPSLVWSVLGIMILQNVKSDELAFYLGAICISFSFAYMALNLWKSSPARKSMPQWLQTLLSPPLFVEGTTSNEMTTSAIIVIFLFFNLSGLMVTLAGIGAPPMMIVILLYEMPVSITRFTFPVAGLISSLFRIGYALYAGLFTFDLWPFFLPASIAAFIGIKIGVGIGNVLSPSMYSATIFCLLICAGTVMLTKNPYVTVSSLVVSCAGLVIKKMWWDKKFSGDNSNGGDNVVPQTNSASSVNMTDITSATAFKNDFRFPVGSNNNGDDLSIGGGSERDQVVDDEGYELDANGERIIPVYTGQLEDLRRVALNPCEEAHELRH